MAKRVTIKQQYQKERKRVLAAIRRLERRGYEVDRSIVPKIPKRPTRASVSRLQKIDIDLIYKKSRYGGEATFGEIVSGEEGRKAERSARSRKSAHTRRERKYPTNDTNFTSPPETIPPFQDFFYKNIIYQFLEELSTYNHPGARKLEYWVNALIEQNGEEDTAIMLQTGAEQGLILTFETVYDETERNNYIQQMINYLPDIGELTKEDLLHDFEDLGIWNEI